MLVDIRDLDVIYIQDEGGALVDVLMKDDELYEKYIKRVRYLDIDCINGKVYVWGGIPHPDDVDWKDFER